MKHFLLSLFVMALASFTPIPAAAASINHAPYVGAQVFIEPGQTPDDVRQWMHILHDNHMTVCRIRMFEDHFRRSDGTWDFTLYDAAFAEADRLGIEVFATLFPHCAMDDLGGPKFPTSQAEYEQTMDFVRHTVEHFAHFRSLRAWVLQNEPGDGKMTDNAWLDSLPHPKKGEVSPDGLLRQDFPDEQFTRYALNHYLSLIAAEIRKIDTRHELHVNPHDICKTLPEYDFRGMSQYLTSLGASMHMSWHFWLFGRNEFPLGVAFMSDLLRPNAYGHPFWVTELQGGNVTFSGRIPVCPSASDISQWMWNAVASGSEGIIFWTLNPRATFMEAGEWAMVDFQRRPSDRLAEAARISATLQKNADFFRDAEPEKSPVTILYNKESLFISHRLGGATPTRDGEETGIPMARQTSAVMRSVIAAYKSLTALGHSPAIEDMEHWTPAADCQGQTVVLPNMLALPSAHNEALREFVRRGGRLVLTGLSGYYNEHAQCLMLQQHPLADILGAAVKEYKYVGEKFSLPAPSPSLAPLPTTCWRGELLLDTASPLISDGGTVLASRNSYGKGEVIWVPSPIEIGARLTESYAPLEAFLADIVAPGAFAHPVSDVTLRTLRSKAGRLAVFTSTADEPREVNLRNHKLTSSSIIYGSATVLSPSRIILPPHSTVVWREK